ncbi:MAG: epoxyqueuosine reductase QueH [Desulfovibrio sp.]|jgi:predicted adenine nucleotide alpha hydrolase (AANH) superfamily ATPase|nr:epoxyqueuosine reductase QueH [Desulfovibrio sp.]
MRILVHVCCGPCSIVVFQRLIQSGHQICGLFFNPNIQPLSEYMARREAAVLAAERLSTPLLLADDLSPEESVPNDPWLCRDPRPSGKNTAFPLPPAADPVPWIRAVSGREEERCAFCLGLRLEKCAKLAKKLGYDAYCSTLLYSRHQDHELIRSLGFEAAASEKTTFVYEDFRVFWKDGQRLSREWDLYRQRYCGCIFSEYERYGRAFAARRKTA